MFGEDGLVQSGLFSDGKLAFAFDVTNKASGFMSISGKYTKTEEESSFGERNEDNKLHGRGIYIGPDEDINIGYFKNG